MKTKYLTYIALMAVSILFLEACNGKQSSKSTSKMKEKGITSTDTNEMAKRHDSIHFGTLLRPSNEFVVTTLPVTTPKEGTLKIPVDTYGTIEADSRATGTISANVSGRIEKLYLRYRFQNIKVGQKVMELYSPEIVTAEENLLFLLNKDAKNQSFITVAKQKLELLGMSKRELNKVIKTGKILQRISVYSNYKGHVMNNGMPQNKMSNSSPVTQSLSLKEGMYVTKGEPLFYIMNHHKTWAALQIFPEDQSLIKKGDVVEITPNADTNVVIKGHVDFIEPFFRKNQKTLTVRVYFNNAKMIAIGSQVKAKIFTAAKKGLWLPQSAVVSLGKGEVAFLKSDGGFRANKITTGLRVDDKIQILSGLTASDTVVEKAHFLMDSQSSIKTSLK